MLPVLYMWEKLLSLSLSFCSAIKEERFRFGTGYDQVEDVIGVAQPMRFNSKPQTLVWSPSRQRTMLTTSHPRQRNAPAGGTTTRRPPAATRSTWGARTTGRLWKRVRRSTALWPPSSQTRSCSSSWRSKWTLMTKNATAWTSAS